MQELVTFGEVQFDLQGRLADGCTKREHLESLARQGDPDALAELAAVPRLPHRAAHVWEAFLDLCQTRGHGGLGPLPLNRLEIHAWEQDEATHLEPWERRAILLLDRAWMRAQAEAQERAKA